MPVLEINSKWKLEDVAAASFFTSIFFNVLAYNTQDPKIRLISIVFLSVSLAGTVTWGRINKLLLITGFVIIAMECIHGILSVNTWALGAINVLGILICWSKIRERTYISAFGIGILWILAALLSVYIIPESVREIELGIVSLRNVPIYVSSLLSCLFGKAAQRHNTLHIDCSTPQQKIQTKTLFIITMCGICASLMSLQFYIFSFGGVVITLIGCLGNIFVLLNNKMITRKLRMAINIVLALVILTVIVNFSETLVSYSKELLRLNLDVQSDGQERRYANFGIFWDCFLANPLGTGVKNVEQICSIYESNYEYYDPHSLLLRFGLAYGYIGALFMMLICAKPIITFTKNLLSGTIDEKFSSLLFTVGIMVGLLLSDLLLYIPLI